ncbi:hypothetical protein TrVE_jg11873 [Triparma verrucosa]|uniref:C2 domain-containing protein n=1 Tax=Triparma verrucosa TaxID=1606542 RepID=A0A9W7C5B3_9STRA|nr:hypothetical protein TrVE_jg11873 [Triparma verrucosa]
MASLVSTSQQGPVPLQQQPDFMEVEVSLHCRGLKKMDLMSNSDPFCVVYLSDPAKQRQQQQQRSGPALLKFNNSSRAVEIGRTEVVYDTQDPDFTATFKMQYHFEENQMLTVKVYDEDKKGSKNLNDHDYAGCATVSLGEVMGSNGNTTAKKVLGGKGNQGIVAIRAEEVTACQDQINLQLAGANLKNKDGWFGKSDPFVTVSRMNEDGTWSLVWKSEVVMDNLSPKFKPSVIQVQKLCNGDYRRPLKFEFLDWDSDGSHDHMGFCETNLASIIAGVGKPEGRMPVQYKNKTHGALVIMKADVSQVPTLTQFLSGGMQMSLMVAVDFTGSNGSPMVPGTLHYLDPRGFPNQYQSAIGTIGSILQEYDSDKKFPIWGFGARLNGVVNHCFQIGPEPEVQGVRGLLEAYRGVFAQGITMSGPTLFSSILASAKQRSEQLARSTPNQQSYSILLILTDGIINDMKQTIDTLVEASDSPLSVIIVGVGSADFSAMEALDGDGGVLKSSKFKPAKRDIVQFVPFSKFAASPSRLAGETLAEIPHQVVQYMMSKKIKPMPAAPPPDYSTMVPPEEDTSTVQGSDTSAGKGDGAPQFFEVSIPPSAIPGTQMSVKSPEGHDIAFIVPTGCPPGGIVRLQY